MNLESDISQVWQGREKTRRKRTLWKEEKHKEAVKQRRLNVLRILSCFDMVEPEVLRSC